MERTKRAEKMAEYIENVSACIVAAIHEDKPTDKAIAYCFFQEGFSRRYFIYGDKGRLLFCVRKDGRIDAHYTYDKDNVYVTPIARFSWYLENSEEFLGIVKEITSWILRQYYKGTLDVEIVNDIACSEIISSSPWNAKWAILHPAGIWFESQAACTDGSAGYMYSERYRKYEMVIRLFTSGLGAEEGMTFAEQTVSAVANLIYNWDYNKLTFDNVLGWSDGDVDDNSSYANWLYLYHPEARNVLSRISTCSGEDDYENLLVALADLLLVEEKLDKEDKLPAEGAIYDCGEPFRSKGKETETITISGERG